MGFIELFLIGVGLAMDAFAVSICKGLNMRKMNYRQATVIALFFGGFQAFMPFLGWSLGRHFEHYIVSIDHWIAFILLAIIGGNKAFCNRYCGRGQLLGKCGKCARNKPAPRWLSSASRNHLHVC